MRRLHIAMAYCFAGDMGIDISMDFKRFIGSHEPGMRD
jgi:hypothetical protein